MPAQNFNAGVLSLKPNRTVLEELLNITATQPIENDAEQGLLNKFYSVVDFQSNAEHTRVALPMKYNLNLEAYESHRGNWDALWPDARVVHFTQIKPQDNFENQGWDQPMQAWRREWEDVIWKYGWNDYKDSTAV